MISPPPPHPSERGRRRRVSHQNSLVRWQRQFYEACITAFIIVVLNSLAIGMADDGYGAWSVIPGTLAAFPLTWLFAKAAFLQSSP